MSVPGGTQSGGGVPESFAARLAVLLVLALCVVTYGRALHGPIFFDDLPNLVTNVLLHIDGRAFDDWRSAALNSDAGLLHRPLAMLSFAINYVIEGQFSAFGLKVVNLALHLLIAVFVYLLVAALLRAPALAGTGFCQQRRQGVALLAAGLWLLHPLHVSTVLYAVQRMAQLSALFSVAGLYVYCRYRLRWIARGASTAEVLAATLWLLLFTLGAVLSKENGALLPLLLAVVEVTLFRGAWCGGRRDWLLRLGALALAAPVALVLLVLLLSPEQVTAGYAIREFTLSERLLTQTRALWHYVWMITVPDITAMGFFQDDVVKSTGLFNPISTLLALIAWTALVGFSLLRGRNFPLLSFATAFFLVAHAMESSFLPLELVFEHRNYLPSVGLCMLLAALLYKAAERLPQARPAMLVSAVLLIWLVALFLRTGAWTDELSLARFNAVNHPASARANYFYGNTLFKRVQNARELGLSADESRATAVAARSYFERTAELQPRSLPALVMLYQMDTLYFTGLAQAPDWLGKVEELAGNRRLQADDFSALEALVAFSALPPAAADAGRIRGIVENLAERFPRNTKILLLQYGYLARQGEVGRQQARDLLRAALEQRPGNRELNVLYMRYHAQEDIAGSYLGAGNWMVEDGRRRDLAVIRRMLDF